MKLFVLAFGVLGLGLELAHTAAFKHPFAHHGASLLLIVGFGLPCLIAMVDLARPLAGWPYLIAACCFAAVFVHARMWELITGFSDLHLKERVFFAATVGGLLASALAARRN